LNAPRVRIVGCGSPDAGDDAIGMVAAQALRERLPPEVDLRTDRAGGANIIEWCEGVEVLILVDAARATSEFPAGQWRCLRFPTGRRRLQELPFRNSHLLGLAEALELAGWLGRLPPQVVVFAVAGAQFALGHGLSPVVLKGLPEVLAAMQAEATAALRRC
jgi:hydrogenase maturation protease